MTILYITTILLVITTAILFIKLYLFSNKIKELRTIQQDMKQVLLGHSDSITILQINTGLVKSMITSRKEKHDDNSPTADTQKKRIPKMKNPPPPPRKIPNVPKADRHHEK